MEPAEDPDSEDFEFDAEVPDNGLAADALADLPADAFDDAPETTGQHPPNHPAYIRPSDPFASLGLGALGASGASGTSRTSGTSGASADHPPPMLQPLSRLDRLIHRRRTDLGGWIVDVLADKPDASVNLQLNTLRPIMQLNFPWKVFDPRTEITFILCHSCNTIIGSTPLELGHQQDETIIHCAISKPFYLGMTAVSQKQWTRMMPSNPSVHQGENLPVDNVTALQCIAFAKHCGPGYRFPHEAEWEFVCRAGSSTPFCHAEELDANLVNFNGRYPYGKSAPGPDRKTTIPVGSLPASRWGFHEMHGNVWEWCRAAKSRYTELNGHIIQTVLRGGSWANHAHSCRCASRLMRPADHSRQSVGFRVAHDMPNI